MLALKFPFRRLDSNKQLKGGLEARRGGPAAFRLMGACFYITHKIHSFIILFAVSVTGCSPSAPSTAGHRQVDASTNSDGGAGGRGEPRAVEMVQIGPGAFLMGNNTALEASPETPVAVAPFRISTTEITVAQYRLCVEAGVCPEPPTFVTTEWFLRDRVPSQHGGPVPEILPCNYHFEDRDTHPMNCVSWLEARVFARWFAKCGRLPTEAEWEYAARAEGGSAAFPWGTEHSTCDHAAFLSDSSLTYCNPIGKGTRPVCGAASGVTDNGLCDLLGNVSEWVEDVYVGTYDCSMLEEGGPDHFGCSSSDARPRDSSAWASGEGSAFNRAPEEVERVHRGGSWLHNAEYFDGTDVYDSRARRSSNAQVQSVLVGFRVAADPADHPNCQEEGPNNE